MSTLVALLHHRWSVPILAELAHSRGARFVTLMRRLGLGRESLTRTLAALVEAGLVARNPGYGHPLRPEYVLTREGARLGPGCDELLRRLRRLDFEAAGLKKWSMPVVLALADGEPKRFSELQAALPGVTGRALTFALRELTAAGLVERTVTDDFPPGTVYRLTPRARSLPPILAHLAGRARARRRTDTARRSGHRP